MYHKVERRATGLIVLKDSFDCEIEKSLPEVRN